MASGKTENYGLNQWKATDKVERLDFNADNAKIDAALHNMAETHNADIDALRSENRIHFLNEWVVEEAVSALSFDLSPYTGAYRKLYLVCSMSASGAENLFCTVNNITSDYVGDASEDVGAKIGYRATTGLYGTLSMSGIGPSGFVRGSMTACQFLPNSELQSNYFFALKSLSFADVKTLQLFFPSDTFTAGSSFALYGLR